jgi:aspartate racemase
MKKIGLAGGISWSSTIDYYRYINEISNKALGGLNYAECIIYSINFEDFRKCNAAHNWDGTFELLLKAVLHLKDAGAEVILLGANTAHIVADRIREKTGLPLVDIRVATAQTITETKIKKVGLLGTVYTMELDFYKNKISEYGIEVMIPESKTERQFIEQTLLHELGRGVMIEKTKRGYLQIINGLIERGAEGIILGCTEIPLLIKQEDVPVPVFNTTQIHATAAVQFALGV